MLKIIPAIMPDNYDDLVNKIERVRGLADLVQIDVMDGSFVSSRSWPYNGDNEGHFERMVLQDEGLPGWENINFSIDLMVSNPETEVERWIQTGASSVIIHIESLRDNGLQYIKDLKERDIISIGLALSPDTLNSELEEYLPYIDVVQFMGIKNVGYQGQEFEFGVLDKIKELRDVSDIEISVDGGVNYDNAKDVVKSGANSLVSGSILFNSCDMKSAIEEFKNMV